MRVLHVIPSVSVRYGGPSTVIWPLCEALAQQPGIQVELATTDADGPGKRVDRSAFPSFCPVHVFPRTISERWKYSRELGRWLDRHVSRYDLIHTHALWTYCTDAAARAAHRASVPYVVRPAGMLSEYSWGRNSWIKRLYWSVLAHSTLAGAAMFHATSPQERDEISRRISGVPISVIPNGVDQGAWDCPPDKAVLRQVIGERCGQRPIVLFLSRLHPKKGIVDLLLPAWKKLRADAFLAIVGGEDAHAPGYASTVRNTIADLELDRSVAWLGPCTAADRWAMFDGADVFVLPSHSENFGVVVAEAMARRCPVIVTETVQSADHVRAAGSGQVVPRDVAVLADALNATLARPEQRELLAESGHSYARANLHWSGIVKKVVEMYGAVLANPVRSLANGNSG